MFNSEEEELRFLRWAEDLHNYRVTDVPVYVWQTVTDSDRYGRTFIRRRKVFSHYEVKGSGPGIPEPTDEELEQAYKRPCRYRRAARASRA